MNGTNPSASMHMRLQLDGKLLALDEICMELESKLPVLEALSSHNKTFNTISLSTSNKRIFYIPANAFNVIAGGIRRSILLSILASWDKHKGVISFEAHSHGFLMRVLS